MFCSTLLYVHSSFVIILTRKIELVALLIFSSWCLVMVVLLFLLVPWVCLRFVIVIFPTHTHLLFLPEFSWLKNVKVAALLTEGSGEAVHLRRLA